MCRCDAQQKNVYVYYNNSILYQFKPHASHSVLEHNELRHRKIKKTFQHKVVLDVFLGDVFFSSPNKHVRPPQKIPPQVASRRTLMPPSC